MQYFLNGNTFTDSKYIYKYLKILNLLKFTITIKGVK